MASGFYTKRAPLLRERERESCYIMMCEKKTTEDSLVSTLSGALVPLAFFIEGLTLVCIIGTAILWGIFGFLYVAEKKLNKPKP